ncbi:MAG: radical SAM/SPASM domain-containing protein [bacterium]
MKANFKSQVHEERLKLGENIPLATPLVVYVEPSGFCNLKCVFCPHGTDSDGLKKDIMSFQTFKKMVDDLSEFEDKISLLRVCGNGDPLMSREIIEMMKYAKESGSIRRIELITNGLLLNTNLIENLPQFLDRIVISIEGLSPEDYLKICSVKMDFQKSLGNLKELYKKRKDCLMHIKIHNEAVKSEDKKEAFFRVFSNYCDEIYIENLVPLWPQLNTSHSTSKFRWGGGRTTRRQICAQIFKSVQVQADGEVVPCCVDWKRINVIGNIKEESLLEIWKGEKLRKLQIRHLSGDKIKTEPCKDCTTNDYSEVDNIDLFAEQCIQKINEKI